MIKLSKTGCVRPKSADFSSYTVVLGLIYNMPSTVAFFLSVKAVLICVAHEAAFFSNYIIYIKSYLLILINKTAPS